MDQEIRDHVAEQIGKLARPKRMIWTYDLPKRGPARSCAGCCATSRPAANSVT